MNKKIVFLLASAITGMFSYAQTPITGFSKATATTQQATEKKFDALLDAKNVDAFIKKLSAQPHHLASPGDEANIQYIAGKFKSWGFDTEIETFYALFPTPVTRLLEMTGIPNSSGQAKNFKASLKEPFLKEDGTSGQAGQLPTYNCYSADGDVTAELVYVNYGVPADYEMLERMGVEVKGKIVIAKYGGSWRGIKPKVAQENGAIGCIIYSDPKGDGYYQGDVYPKGPYKPEYGVQRGSVLDMPVYPGDPLTPGIGSVKDTKSPDSYRGEREDAVSLLKIPVLPISYADAKPLLESLEGAVVPDSWRGALPITYHVGPSRNKVHLQLSFDWKVVPVKNIIAKLKGSELPDEWVIRGNHHDAWVNGAADPVSGLAALMEEARAVGEMAKDGFKPKRTIVYCAWDGEEEGLLGSTEWVEHHAEELKQKAVLYINTDGNGRGFLYAGGSHALETAFTEITKEVTDPQANVSVFQRKKSSDIITAATTKAKKENLEKQTFDLYALGSGSDYSPFFQHLGINSLNIGFGGEDEGGEYHSIYDSYDMYRRFKDPTFEYGVALAKVCGRSTLRFANAEILPFDFRSLHKTINKYATELITMTDEMRESTVAENKAIKGKDYLIGNNVTEPLLPPAIKDEVPYLDFSPLQNAIALLEKAAGNIASTKDFVETIDEKNNLNKVLIHAEQALLTKGLPRRNWYRHSIYAPGFYTGYGVKTLPGIREAIEQRNWPEAEEQIKEVAAAIHQLSFWLNAGLSGL
jgi:N-acetylated-alpha-linked acidic dipeptidase